MNKDTPPRPVDTPEGSTGGDEQQGQSSAKYAAVKDRKCQYCQQDFTSSSLGRHLDQFLFKKKPDGIHDIEEIRRIRSGITRRQARTSSGRRDSLERSVGRGQTDSSYGASETGGRSRDGFRMMFNTPTWHATGVINDIPDPDHQRDTAKNGRRSESHSASNSFSLPDYANRGSSAPNSDTMRALELALREVLDNIRSTKLRPRVSPFEFDIQAQTFPSLCLQLLPAPSTLFALQPFATPASFPLHPPGQDHLDIVKEALCAKIAQWHSDQLAVASSDSSQFSKTRGFPLDSNMIDQSARQHEEISCRHLNLSFSHWISLPAEVRRDQWQLEIIRAFVRETERRKSLDEQLERVQQEANQLRTQVLKLGSCQWPREFSLFPPDFLPLPREVVMELDSKASVISPDSPRWDYDNLVGKWKRVVMHDKGMGRVGVGQSVLTADNDLENAAPRNVTDSTNNPTGAATAANRAKRQQSRKAGSPDRSKFSETGAVPMSAPASSNTYVQNRQNATLFNHDTQTISQAGPPSKRPRLTNGHLHHGQRGGTIDDENQSPVSSTMSQRPADSSLSRTPHHLVSNVAPHSSPTPPPSYPEK